MNVLFVHNNFPAQFRNLATALASNATYRVAAICAQTGGEVTGVATERYTFDPSIGIDTHPFARRFDLECRRAEQVLYAAARLAAAGFRPDIILVHCGWGENIPLRAVFPQSKIIVFCEFFYRSAGLDVGFDPELPPLGIDGHAALHTKNAATLLALADADMGLSPTRWQRSTYPAACQSQITVAHEGIDVERVRPKADAVLSLPSGRRLSRSDEVLTYVARDLEPLRGFRSLMRALPAIQSARPRTEVVLIGGDSVSYGAPPVDAASWKEAMLREVGARLDLSRIHFLGRVPFETYLAALQVSRAHVYLTYPFVLSWSLLEAMAAGCGVVASDTAPVTEVVNGENGILAPFFDTERLAERVCRLLADPGQSAAFGIKARRTIEAGYDRHSCTARLIRLLDDVHATTG